MYKIRPLLILVTLLSLMFSACAQEKNKNKVVEVPKQKKTMKVEIWSDIMCPFCYIGKRHFEAALKQLPDNVDVEIVWKSYQLDPSIPQKMEKPESVYQYLASRKGITLEQSIQMHDNVVIMAKEAGLNYRFDKAIVANSFKAHRLIQFAKTKGIGGEAEERFFQAYFMEGINMADDEALEKLAIEIGLSTSDVKEALTNETYAEKVDRDINEAENLGLSGVPFFVFDRKFAVSGAQPVDTFFQAFQKSLNN